MPEGPEVKRMAHDLAREVTDNTLESVSILSGRYTKKSIEGLTEVNSVLPTRIIGAGCHGKFLYVLTASGFNIWNTLGMTGQWSRKKTKHTRVSLNFSNDDPVYFNDMRNFGTLKIVYGKTSLIEKIKSLGPDILSSDIDEDFFLARMREKDNVDITKVLMNQKVFAGIGNYIKAESLWLAEIDPNSKVCNITDKKLKKLCKAVKNVMVESYNTGGATFRSHKNFSGIEGDYSSRFLCYGRKIDAEGNLVMKTKTADGRTTHWSPEKQGEKND